MNNNIGWENPKGNGGNGNYDDTVIKNQINILDDKIDDIDLQLDTKANKTEIPTKVSQLENDSGFTTETYVDNAIANNENSMSNVTIFLPNEIYHLGLGDCKRVFKNNIIATYNLSDFRLGHAGDVLYDYFPNYIPIKTNNLQIGIYNTKTNKKLKTQTVYNHIVDPSKKALSETKNILILGDSFIEQGYLPCKIKSLLVNDYGFTNVNFIGKKNVSKNEINCLCQGTSSSLIYDYVKTTNSTGTSWMGNPFNFNGELSVLKYCQENEFSGIDICLINLGINDFLNSTYKPNMFNNLQTLIDCIHSDYPNCLIYVNGLLYASNNNTTKNIVEHNRQMMEVNSRYQEILNSEEYNSFCRYVDTAMTFLIDYGYPYEMKNVYPGSTETIKIETDWIHPSQIGYHMMAENDVACILNDFVDKE